MNDLQIQLYLENDKQERFDLIRNGVSLKLGSFKSTVEYDYDEYSFQNNLKTVQKTTFKPKKLDMEMAVVDESTYSMFIDFLNKQPKGMKLFYSNKQKSKEVFAFVDIEKASAVQVKRSDQRDFDLTLNLVSPWFKLKNISFLTTENYQHKWYGANYPLRYSSPPVKSYGETSITNEGQTEAPFIIICEAGGVDLKWRLLDDSQNIVIDKNSGAELSGAIDYISDDEIIIDNFNNRIVTGSTDISYCRDRYLLSFFNIPVGNYILKIEGTNKGLRGILYESYQQV